MTWTAAPECTGSSPARTCPPRRESLTPSTPSSRRLPDLKLESNLKLCTLPAGAGGGGAGVEP